MQLADLKGIFHTDILTLKKVENPFGDYWIFDFDAGENTWITGDHAFFSINGDYKGRKWRALSLASNHEEGIIKVGTKIGSQASEYKKVLKNLKLGDTVKMRGPFGWFKIQDETSPIIMIAGGIGITPFRALMDRLKDTQRPVTLLYSSNDGYLFEDEFNNVMKQNSNINVVYMSGREELQKQINTYVQIHGNDAYYFISGLPQMITSIKKDLANQGIQPKHMLNDVFYGY